MKAIIEYVPKTKREAIRDAYRDDDGYWISLKEGWEASNTDSGCRTIHEDTIAELKYQIAGIRRKENNTMAKTSIINVEIREELNTAYVTYSTGTEKLYPANKLPKTVQVWMEEHQTQEPEPEPEEKINLDDDNHTMYLDLYAEGATWHPVDGAVEGEPETVEEVTEAVEAVQADLPAVAQKPELTVPDNSLGAAEAVGFGVMMAMAVAYWGIVGLVQILMSGIEVLWTLARPRVVRLARSTVRSLPTITTKKGLAVAVRVLPMLVGIMALM